MRYRRFRRRYLTPAQKLKRAEINAKALRLNILLGGIGESIRRFGSVDVEELDRIVDMLSTEVVPLARDIELLESQVYGRRLVARMRKNPSPRKTVKKSAKNKKGKA